MSNKAGLNFEKPRISVLMAIFNCADTLEEAIDSLLNQTYKNFKLILCDDASTDKTYSIAKEYADKYDNIILLRNEENLKLASSLNRCLEYADTEYIARMDGDDISLPSRFEKQINFLDQHPEFALVSTPMIYFDENGDWGKGVSIPEPTKYDFKKGTPHVHAPAMVRTYVMNEVNGYTVNKYLIRGQDYYLWYKIYKAGYRGFNMSEPLYKMRDDKDAMNRRTFRTRYNGFIVKKHVMKELGISNAFYYAIPDLIKAFIPDFLMKKIRKKKMGI
ncbi:glycosyltransferase [Aequorivita sp. 609]|uniref:glycosyltransferase n=1 Tax=Aequorivita TaxID=153265 RepID=UPI001614AA47|nr:MULTISPECIES: glycosyltransferase [Aequorivita]MBB6681530.1 glycosyltransferase [Aequorivita sp. 609]